MNTTVQPTIGVRCVAAHTLRFATRLLLLHPTAAHRHTSSRHPYSLPTHLLHHRFIPSAFLSLFPYTSHAPPPSLLTLSHHSAPYPLASTTTITSHHSAPYTLASTTTITSHHSAPYLTLRHFFNAPVFPSARTRPLLSPTPRTFTFGANYNNLL